MKNKPIGIFDSGVGGLTVAKAILELLPNESVIYIGDTARIPYGTRGRDVITSFATELVEFLLKKDVKYLVAACNTISATCLEEIQKLSPVPILGVIKPAAKEAIKTTKSGKIGVIGTRATIGSKIYEKELKILSPDVEVTTKACPMFVPIAEEALGRHEIAKTMAYEYLTEFKDSGIDTLILGCTHYPLLREVIQEAVGNEITLIDSASPTARLLNEELEKNNLFNERSAERKFYVTDAPERVYQIADVFLGKHVVPTLEKVTL